MEEDPGRDAAMADAPADALPSGAVRGARPATDAVAMDAVRARVEQLLFGRAAPARPGGGVWCGAAPPPPPPAPSVVGERPAGGGGGIFSRADDPELHRKVA